MGADDRGWGPGWPRCQYAKIADLSVAGVDFPGGVHRRVKPIMAYVARRFHTEVESLHDGWCWGFSCRPIGGTSTPSNHSYGLAIDLNAPKHPYGESWTFSANQVRSLRSVIDGLDIRWGGDYDDEIDQMHLEFMGTPHDADRISKQLRDTGESDVEWVNREQGDRGHGVEMVQAMLNANGGELTQDGIFGPNTKNDVKRFQEWADITVDGVVGPQTYTHLLYSNIRGDQVPGVYG